MANSIDDLKSTIAKKGGLSPTNRFNVIFTPPTQSLLNLNAESIVSSVLSGNFNAGNLINDPRDISILCQSVNMPGRTIATFEHQDYKQLNKFPYTFIDDDVTMEFLVTNDYYIRQMFDNWMEGIYSTTSHRVGYKKDYSCDVVIQHLNRENIPIYGVRLEKAFPTNISSLELNSDQDAGAKIQITWAYDKFVPEGPVSSTGSAIRAALDIFG